MNPLYPEQNKNKYMQEWKLPSQLVTTDREENENLDAFFKRHETMRRITAEDDLVRCLDFIDSLPKDNIYLMDKINNFLARYLDKTINN